MRKTILGILAALTLLTGGCAAEADWKAEAVESAKSYLETGAFSRQGLVDQLSSAYGDQFTKEQAVYAVNKAGL